MKTMNIPVLSAYVDQSIFQSAKGKKSIGTQLSHSNFSKAAATRKPKNMMMGLAFNCRLFSKSRQGFACRCSWGCSSAPS